MAIRIVAGLRDVTVVGGARRGRGGGGLALVIALVTPGIHNTAAVRQQQGKYRPGHEGDMGARTATGGHHVIRNSGISASPAVRRRRDYKDRNKKRQALSVNQRPLVCMLITETRFWMTPMLVVVFAAGFVFSARNKLTCRL